MDHGADEQRQLTQAWRPAHGDGGGAAAWPGKRGEDIMATAEKSYQQYLENTVASAKPEELTLMLYNGLAKFIARAQDEIRAADLEAAHNTLLRCQDIVFEFQFTLDTKYEVANSLMLMYDYLYNRLIEANAKKDADILDEVYGFVTELRDTWIDAVKLNRERKTASPVAAPADASGGKKAIYARPLAVAAQAAQGAQGAQAAQGISVAAQAAQAAQGAHVAQAAQAGQGAQAGAAVATQPAQAIQPPQRAQAAATPIWQQRREAATPQTQQGQQGQQPAARQQAPRPFQPAFGQQQHAAAGGASIATKVFGDPFNKANPSIAAQYAKVSQAKTPWQGGSISIASK
ncbi:MAG: flagellar export chaperone FliS [Clostridiales bacterium]|nr:flagellar export chaperone FliS [Clostridiales bacterium]